MGVRWWLCGLFILHLNIENNACLSRKPDTRDDLWHTDLGCLSTHNWSTGLIFRCKISIGLPRAQSAPMEASEVTTKGGIKSRND